jgi:hypothetical protein
VQLDGDADLHERGRHVRAQVLVVIHGRHREVALLRARLVAAVAHRALVLAAVPHALDRVDEVHRQVRPCLEPHLVEDEELGLRSEVRGVGDAGGEEVLLRLLCDVARIAAVALARDRVGDEAVQHQRLAGAERVDVRRIGVGHEDHVRLLDLLEAADRGPVEAVAVLEGVLAQHRCWDRHVLHDPGEVREPQVDEFARLVLDERQHLSCGPFLHVALLGWSAKAAT